MFMFLACNQTKPKKETPTSQAKEVVQIGKENLSEDDEGNPILIGEVSLDQVKQFTTLWFEEEYDRYRPNQSEINEIAELIKGKNLVLFMGTWCEDSQREVPAIFKVLDAANFDTSSVKIIAINEPKSEPKKWIEQYTITYVPALIFLENEKEMNRIIEFPIATLEKDMLSILKGEAYKNAYAE